MILDFRVIILGIVAVINLVFGILVLAKSKRREALTFGFFILSLVVWTFGLFMFHAVSESQASLFWAKFLYFAGNCTSVFFLFFALNFPQKKTTFSSWQKTFLVFVPLGILFILYFFSDSIISGTLIKQGFIYGPFRF